jgi:hypothetical protein
VPPLRTGGDGAGEAAAVGVPLWVETVSAKTFGPKVLGQCLQCQAPTFDVLQVYEAPHPLAGQPRRLGAARENQTQVRFLLSTGATADVGFCLDCARALQPDDFWPIWRACVARNDLSLQLANRSETVRRAEMTAALAVFPLTIVGRRIASPDGLPMLDRR